MSLQYSYWCQYCGERFTGWNEVSKRHTHECKHCGELAELFINGAHFKLDPISGDFPSATDQWAKAREKANLDDLKSLGLRKTTKRFYL